MTKSGTNNRFSAFAPEWLGYLLLGFSFLFLFAYIFDDKLNLGGDNAAYYILSKALASGEGFINIQLPEPTPHTHFPPGYPLLLAIASLLGMGSIVGLKVFTGLFLSGSGLMLYALGKKLTDNKLAAWLAAAFFMMNYHVLYYSTIIMSEVPFIFFSLLSIWLYLRLIEDQLPFFRSGHFWSFMIVLVFAFHIRTVGIALLLGFLVDLGLKRKWGLLAGTFTGFLAGGMPWILRNHQYGGSSYLKQLLMVNPYKPESGQISTIGDWIVRIGNNLNRYMAHEIPTAFFPSYTVDYHAEIQYQYAWITVLIVALLGFSLYHLKTHRSLLLSYFGATVGILMLWPDAWYGTRFFLPLIPLVFLLALWGFWIAIAKWIPSFKRYRVLIALPLLWVYLPKIHELNLVAKQPYLPEYQTYFQAAKWAQRNTNSDIVIATRKPNLFFIFAERACVSYPYIFDHTRFLDSLEAMGVTHVVLEQLGYSSGIRYLYPAIAANREKFMVDFQTPKPETYLFRFDNEPGYRGEWRIDTPEGEYHDPVIGVKEGQGQYVFSDGSYYKGGWLADQRSGFGIMYYSNGHRFEGIWKANKKHGSGKLLDANGKLLGAGIWEMDSLTQER
jgi:4-amino-4-deoxy-L-arabinose transferase-like glycosyltransferase